MKYCFLILLSLLCLGISACGGRNPGVALGVGSHGGGLALFSDGAWIGGGSGGGFGGLSLGLGGDGRFDDGGYSGGRIVRAIPKEAASPEEPLVSPVHEDARARDM